MLLVVVSVLAAQISVDPAPLLAAGEDALADDVVSRLLDEGFTLWPESPRLARLLLSMSKDGVVVGLDEPRGFDAVDVPKGDAAVVGADVAHAALGLLRKRRVTPDGVPRGAVDVGGVKGSAAVVVAAGVANVAVARGAAHVVCVGDAPVGTSAADGLRANVVVVVAAKDAGCVVDEGAHRSWAYVREAAREALIDADIADTEEDGWSEAPTRGGPPGPDERARPSSSTSLAGVAGRVHLGLGSAARPWSETPEALGRDMSLTLDPALTAGVDVTLPSGWFALVTGGAAARAREGVRVSSFAGGVGGGHVFFVGDFSASVGVGGGGSADFIEGRTSSDLLASLALFVPVVVGFDVGGGTSVEVSSVIRVTDATVSAQRAGHDVWKGGPVTAFVAVGASFGGRSR